MVLSTRCAAALLLLAVSLCSSRTWADTRAPLRIEQGRDPLLGGALTKIFDDGGLDSRRLPGFGTARHIIDLASTRFKVTPRLTVGLGIGVAHLVESDFCSHALDGGSAITGSIAYAVVDRPRYTVGVEVSSLRVHYAGGSGLNDSTMMLALSTR